MKAISSTANPSYRSWLRLASHPRETRAQRRTLAEGVHLAQAALAAEAAVEAVLLRRGPRGRDVEGLVEAARATGAAGFELDAALYDRISPAEHGAGLMFVIAVPLPQPPSCAGHDMVFLDGLQDPGNAGSVLRSAAAAGIVDVLAGPTTAALWAPKTMRAGQGAQFRLRLHQPVNPEQLPQLLDGEWIGADARGGEPLWRASLPPGPIGWVFGAEGAGLSAPARGVCARQVSIPIDSSVESLNVAAAAAVCLFERRRRAFSSR